MSNKTHPAEVFCRKTFLRNPRAKEHAAVFYSQREEMRGNWPEWCGLPMSATYAILTEGAPVEVATGILARGAGVLELSNLTAALLWDKSKVIYRYDKTLADVLAAQPLDGDVPRDILMQLPHYCIYIEREFMFDRERVIGFFAWLEHDTHSRVPELRLLYLLASGYAVSIPVILTGGTLEDSTNALIQSGLERAMTLPLDLPADVVPFAPSDADVVTAINLILYLCASEPDVPRADRMEQRRSRAADGTPKRAATIDTGMRIGAALRRAQQVSRPEAGETDGGTAGRQGGSRKPMRAHMRRAHWHAYWTGTKAERKLIVKWIPPIEVNMDGETGAVIYPVK